MSKEKEQEQGEDFFTYTKTEPKPAIVYTHEQNFKWNLERLVDLNNNELLQLENNVIQSALQSSFVLRNENTEELQGRLDSYWTETMKFLETLYLSNPAILNTLSKKTIKKSLRGVENLKSIFQRNAQIEYLDNIIASVKEAI